MREAIVATVAFFVVVAAATPTPPPVAPDIPCGFALHQSRSAPATPELEAAADEAYAQIEEKGSGVAVKRALALLAPSPTPPPGAPDIPCGFALPQSRSECRAPREAE